MHDPVPPRLRVAILALAALLTVASVLGAALSPYLLVTSPLLLVTVSAASHHVALAAATVDPLPLIAVATVRRTFTVVAAFGIGVLYGRAAVSFVEQRYPRLARIVALIERLFARFGLALVTLAPAPTVAVLAGAARTRFVLFLPAVFVGLALWTSINYGVGDALSRWTDALTGFVREHLLASTLVCTSLVALQQIYARFVRPRTRARPSA